MLTLVDSAEDHEAGLSTPGTGLYTGLWTKRSKTAVLTLLDASNLAPAAASFSGRGLAAFP